MFWKAFIVGLLIALGEVANGNVRVRVLNRKWGKQRAKTISFFFRHRHYLRDLLGNPSVA